LDVEVFLIDFVVFTTLVPELVDFILVIVIVVVVVGFVVPFERPNCPNIEYPFWEN
jgi:hypothetical protein